MLVEAWQSFLLWNNLHEGKAVSSQIFFVNFQKINIKKPLSNATYHSHQHCLKPQKRLCSYENPKKCSSFLYLKDLFAFFATRKFIKKYVIRKPNCADLLFVGRVECSNECCCRIVSDMKEYQIFAVY